MSELRFYNYEFEPIAIENEIISVYETVYFNDIGIFEARLNPYSKAFLKIINEPYLLVEDEGRLFVVTAKQADDVCTIYARTPNWFLSKRIVAPFTSKRLFEMGDISAKTADEIVKFLIGKHFGADNGNFQVTGSTGVTDDIDFRRIVLNPLSTVVSECLDTAKAGHEVYYDKNAKRWVFKISAGRKSGLIIGESQKNTVSSKYTDNALSYSNCGVYEKSFEDMGSWDAQSNNPELLGVSAESYGKRYYVEKGGTQFGITFTKGEYAVYAREDGKISAADAESGYVCEILDDESKGLYRWYDSLTARTEETAKAELGTKKWEKSIEAESDGLKLGRDYLLGDVVKVKKKIGNGYITSEKRIIGTEFYIERGEKNEKIIFGEV